MEVYGLEEKQAIEELKNKKADYFMISNLTSKTLLNLIEKQQKEIEELKEENEKYKNPPFFDEENYISKEEAKQKERKAYIKGTNDADELCNKKWEDKIKAKIEEYDDKGMTKYLGTRSYGKTFQQVLREELKKVLQSLLEKE